CLSVGASAPFEVKMVRPRIHIERATIEPFDEDLVRLGYADVRDVAPFGIGRREYHRGDARLEATKVVLAEGAHRRGTRRSRAAPKGCASFDQAPFTHALGPRGKCGRA